MDKLYPQRKEEYEETFFKPAEKWSSVFDRGDVEALVEAFQEHDEFATGTLDFRNLVKIQSISIAFFDVFNTILFKFMSLLIIYYIINVLIL
jgi:hypothetical protein